MYNISPRFREIIDNAGGPEAFASQHDLNPDAIRAYYNGTRKIQETTARALAEIIELWKTLVD